MERIKTLGLVVAMMTLAVVIGGIGSASAATKFTAGKVGAKLTESTLKQHVLSITGSSVECSEISFTGATEGLETTGQVVTPSLSGCTAFGFAATVTNSGCQWRLTVGGLLHIEPFNCVTTITVNNFFAKCHVDIFGGQTLQAVGYTNGLGGRLITKFNTSALGTQVTTSSGLCPLTVGKHSNSQYVGESEFAAEGTTISVD